MSAAADPSRSPRGGHAFCTIIAKNYLAHARALHRSLRNQHPEAPLYVLLVDEVEERFEPAAEDFILVPLRALDPPARLELCFRYELLELCTAVKPFFLRWLFAEGHSKLVFLDPDIWVYRPLDAILGGLDRWDVILTPHLTGRVDDGGFPDERLMLLVGAYNLGFLALARSAAVDGLLDWWWAHCERDCLLEMQRGLFLDQKWMNLVPGMFDRVLVLRDPGYNLAHWNLNHRVLTGPPAGPLVNGRPLYFLHGSSVDPLDPSRLACPQTRYEWLEGEPLLSMLRSYSAELLAAGYQTCRSWPYSYGRFRDGHAIHPEMRRLFREQPAGRFPDPFETDGPDSFPRWASAPCQTRSIPARPPVVAAHPPGPAASLPGAGDGSRVMPLLQDLYRSRRDLQRRFPMSFVEEHDAPRFRTWIQEHAAEIGWDGEVLQRASQLFNDTPGPKIEALYRRRPDVEAAYPAGLSWPPDPGFVTWLWQSGRWEHGLPPDWISWFAERTSQHVCPRILALYRSRPAWRDRHPRAFAASGQAAFLAWIKTLPPEELGFEVGGLEHVCPPPTPLEELKRLHRLDAGIRQAFPEAFRQRRDTDRLLRWAEGEGSSRFGWEAGFRERLDEELRTVGFRGKGVTVVGYLRAESGMGELARSTVRALRQVSYPLNTLDLHDRAHRHSDLSVVRGGEVGSTPGAMAGTRLPITIAVLTAPQARRDRAAIGLPHPYSYAIGYWPWELEVFPDDLPQVFEGFDEVWALSRFSAAAIAAASPVPVHTVWPALPDVEPGPAGPTGPALDPGEFNFLFVYDLLSETERKNPEGLLRAFRDAFHPEEPVRLTIKTINGEMRSDELRRVVKAAEGLRATVHDRYVSRADLLRLVASCDSYVSLHRAEGFGFTLAEAMALGKPVIATFYSGNTDYMTPWSCLPVPYRMTEVGAALGAYRPGDAWAEPDLEVAADLMRRLYREPDEGRAVGSRGQRHVRGLLSLTACGERMAARLRTIQ